uniref:Cytochrome c oxidase assembly factor 1 n=1 Tax=Microcebus murinus TaxID=30608 RepID=A0A8C5YBX0_MICMU
MMWQKHSGSRMSMSLGKLILFAGVLTSGGSALVYYFVQSEYLPAAWASIKGSI